jgi:hypothetical protein
MALSLTYDTVLSRVRLSATGLIAGTDTALVERSVDQITWTVVRGGQAVPVIAGAAALDDYEFAADVANFYRVSAVDADPITYVGAGSAASGNNSSLGPALPAGLVDGDLLLCPASIRNSGAGTVNTPPGWTALATSGNVTLLGRRYVAGDGGPLVTFTGGVANADTIAQIAAWRNAELVPIVTNPQLNGSAQNIAYPAVTITGDGRLVLVVGWKADDWTSVAALAGMAEVGETVSTAGDDAGLVWDYQIQTTATNIGAGSLTVTGGAAAISRGLVAVHARAAYRTRQTASITPSLAGRVWLKCVGKPFLNRAVTVMDFSTVERAARTGLFDVVGRSVPIAVSDLRGPRRWSLQILAQTLTEASNLDQLLASGEPLFIHVPANVAVPGGYVTVGDISQERLARLSVRRAFVLPCTEVAAPGPDIVGTTVTWQTVLNAYGTWAAVLAAHPTWADLLELIGSPSDVIVS